MEDIFDKFQTSQEKILNIANEVKKARKSQKISQEKLALMSNVSFGSVKRFEQTGEISLYSLIKLCNCLKIKIKLENYHQLSEKELGFYG